MIKKITIINGNPNHNQKESDLLLKNVQTHYSDHQSEIKIIDLANEEFSFCVGCWDCWWKTPGLCRFKDSVHKILPEIIRSDIVIYFSPLIMGFYSALLKKFLDRTIPLVHPYVEYVNKETHHIKRYPKYPKIGVIIDEKNAKKEEIDLVKQVFERYALNFKSELDFFYSVNSITEKSLVNETSSF